MLKYSHLNFLILFCIPIYGLTVCIPGEVMYTLYSFAMELTSSAFYFQSELLKTIQLRPQDSWSHNIRVGIMAILQNRVGMFRQFAELYSLYYFTFCSPFLFVPVLSS